MAALGFAAPWMLAALLLLPAIYWLLRLTPPLPRRVWFPPLKLLRQRRHEDTPQSSPLWLTILRLALAACLILAFAKPVWRAEPVVALMDDLPLVLIVDNGWPAAPDWRQRIGHARDLIERADTRGLPVMLIASSHGAAQSFRFIDAKSALAQLLGLEPQAMLAKRMPLIKPMQDALVSRDSVQFVWLSDGVETGDAADFLTALKNLRAQTQLAVLTKENGNLRMLAGASNAADALEVQATRLDTKTPAGGTIRAFDRQNRLIASSNFSFETDAAAAKATIALPANLRNDVFRLDIADEPHAGAVFMLDDRWQRKTVGIYSGSAQDYEQPLLSSLFILSEAMTAFAEVSKAGGSVADSLQSFIQNRLNVIVLADVGAIPESLQQPLADWINDGGVLIRFAGPRLLELPAGADPLLPVNLRPNVRALGGELTWEKAQKIGRFSGPLAGIAVPSDILVSRQVLAEAETDIQKKIWAELEDGSPLVTARAQGRGQIVLVHVAADPNWSNLPLSGTFLDMLRQFLQLSTISSPRTPAETAAQSSSALLKPLRSLNAHGMLTLPPASAQPLASDDLAGAQPDAEHPPGLYGSEAAYLALNAMRADDKLAPVDFAAQRIQPAYFGNRLDEPLQAKLLTVAFFLFVADCVFSILLLGGGLRLKFMRMAVFLFALLPASFAFAQTSEDSLAAAANETRLAYVKTGIADIDEIARAGLKGLSQALRERTAVEPADPAGVDLEKDELAFYPVLYWPIDPGMPKPSPSALDKAEAYMKNGGTIVFDTRDRGETWMGGVLNATPGEIFLRGFLDDMNVPKLEAVPNDHVLTKSFYILTSFPGRFEDGPLWVERTTPNPEPDKRPVRQADGVSSIIITSNDFAGAWAVDDAGSPLLPLYGSDSRQRELALRAGINIVVYVLTGNYKSDQVHVPDILQRLGQ